MAGKYDDMSFKKAFVAARKAQGAGKVFTWKGKRYTTNYKEEEKKKVTKPKSRPKSGAPKSSTKKPKVRPGSQAIAKPGSLNLEKITVTKLSPGKVIKTRGAQAKRSIGEREAASDQMKKIKKIMKKDFGDRPGLLDDLARLISNFRAKQGKPKKKDPRK